MKLSDFRISKKILSVIFVLGFVAISIAATGTYGVKRILVSAEKMNESGKVMRIGAQAYVSILALSRGEYRAAAAPSEIDDIMPLVEKYKVQLGEKLEALDEKLDGEYQARIDKIKKEYEDYAKLADETFALAERYKNVHQSEEQAQIYKAVLEARTKANIVNNEITELNNQLSKESDALESDTEELSTLIERTMLLVALIGISLGIFIGLYISNKGIVDPIQKIVGCLSELSNGNLKIDIFGTDRKDEVGDIAKTTLVFKENMIKAKDAEEKELRDLKAKEERQIRINNATDKFQAAMQDIVKTIASASTELQASAESMSATAEETSKQSNAVAAASEQVTANVQTVASASEEMTASIKEIAEKITASSQMANNAVANAKSAGGKVIEMVEAARKIGEVTNMISDISAQTNLLALNATIEAARAGEAGRGFAVVANEVKSLANSSAKATEEIAEQITSVQQVSTSSADAIEEISKLIEEINEVSSAIAAAIQEQSAATEEIARNANEASKGTSEVSGNIISVSEAANHTGASSHQVLSAAQELAKQADVLKVEFDTFINTVKNA